MGAAGLPFAGVVDLLYQLMAPEGCHSCLHSARRLWRQVTAAEGEDGGKRGGKAGKEGEREGRKQMLDSETRIEGAGEKENVERERKNRVKANKKVDVKREKGKVERGIDREARISK